MSPPEGTPPSFHQDAVPAQPVQQNILSQSHASENLSSTFYQIQSSEQQNAVALLQEFPNSTIFAWLTGLRSYLRSEQRFLPSHLSPQQLQALTTLKDCSDDLIRTWLDLARSQGIPHAPHNLHGNTDLNTQRVAAPLASDASRCLSTTSTSPTSFLDQSSFFSTDLSIHGRPRSRRGQEWCPTVSRDSAIDGKASPTTTSKAHSHWCFICDDPQPIATCDGFKRHVREHESRYCCMLRGPVMRTNNGEFCVFCGCLDPDEEHLNTHNYQLCEKKPIHARSYTRKESLMKHLRKHNVFNDSTPIGKWRNTVDKKYFACGFCVSCFDSLTKQLNHIDTEHYRFSRHIRDWDFDKVIRGLLSQPGVDERWRSALRANPHLQESSFSWKPILVKELQFRLEMSGETADVLSAAAIDQSNYGRSGRIHVESAPDAGFGRNLDSRQSMQTFQHQDIWSTLPSDSYQVSTVHTLPMTAPTLQSQQLARNWDDPTSLKWNEPYGSGSVSQIAPEMFASSANATPHRSNHLAKHHCSPDSGNTFMQQQHTPYMSSTVSASDSSYAWEGRAGTSHSSRLGDQSQSLSPNVITNLRPRQVAEAHRDPVQAHTSVFHTTSETQSTPYDDIDMDVGLKGMQHTRPDQHRKNRQR